MAHLSSPDRSDRRTTVSDAHTASGYRLRRSAVLAPQIEWVVFSLTAATELAASSVPETLLGGFIPFVLKLGFDEGDLAQSTILWRTYTNYGAI